MNKRIVILGSTGSIGRQMLEIVRSQPDIQVLGLAAGQNLSVLAEQVAEFRPSLVSFTAKAALDPPPAYPVHYCSLEEMAAAPEADIILVGTVGNAGLAPTLAALRAGKT